MARSAPQQFPYSRMREIWATDEVYRSDVEAADNEYREAVEAADRKRTHALRVARHGAAARFYAREAQR